MLVTDSEFSFRGSSRGAANLLKATFHSASFETPGRPMCKDQSVLLTHRMFLGRPHLIFKHWTYRILKNR